MSNQELQEDLESLLQDIESRIAKRLSEIERNISPEDILRAGLTGKVRAMRDLHHILSLERGKPTEITKDLSVEVVLAGEDKEGEK